MERIATTRDSAIVSRSMRAVRSVDTAPEVALRKRLWHAGLLYRLGRTLPGRPDLVFPRQGAVLLGSTVMFTWTSGKGNTTFDLWLGSSPDAADIFDRRDGPGTSQVVDNIPLDGRPVYVRLTSSDGTESGTFIRSYTFSASRN